MVGTPSIKWLEMSHGLLDYQLWADGFVAIG
jgi:hypothetical protein